MNWLYTPYSIPLFLAAIISGGFAYYAWKRRSASGATAFALLMLFIAEWSLAYALEVSSATLEAKVFWAKVQYVGIAFLPLAWLAFALQYTNFNSWLSRRNVALLSIMPVLTVLLMWTNEAHMLIWIKPQLVANGPFPAINKAYGSWFWVHSIYSYILLLIGTILLIRLFIRSPHLYRQQAGLLLLGALIPWVGNGLSIAGLKPIPNLDLTPFAFTLSGVVMGWALFRYQLLDIMPVARRAVVDGLSDGIIVLNTQNRIVDLNQAAQRIIGYNANEAIGKAGAEIFADRLDLVEQYRHTTEAQTEIVLGEAEHQQYFDLRISPLYDQQNHLIGRLIVLRDITQRKLAEEALEQQYAFLWQVIDINPHFIFAKDRQMRYTLVNQAFAQAYHTTVKEMIGKTDSELHPNQEMANRYDHQDTAVIETGQELILPEVQIVDVAGQPQWRHTIKRPITDKNGEIQQLLGVVTDITERKRTEENLRKSEERLRQVFTSISDHIYMTEFTQDGQRINHYMSPTIELTGYPLENFLADWSFWPSKIIHPDDKALATAQAERLAMGYNSEVEYRMIRADGSVIWVRDSGRVEKNGHNQSIMVYGVVSDISERKQTEEELRKLSRAVEQSASTIVITDLDGAIEFVNPAFSQTTGYSYEEAIGQNPRLLKSDKLPLKFYKTMWETLRRDEIWQGEIVNKKKNGELFWEFATISPLKNKNGETTHYVAVKDDITEKKRIEEERRVGYEQQYILSSILQIGLENIPLDNQLEQILQKILAGPWLSSIPQGGIFLVEDEPDILVLKAEHNLPPALRTICASIPFGQCSCGQAAAKGKVIFANCVDEQLKNNCNCAGMEDHGHYSIPILSAGQVLGVILLFVPAGHQETDQEVRFLTTIANTLAAIIERKRAEEALAQTRDQALEASRLKSQLLANVSHDLRSPLGAVMGYTEMLQEGVYGSLTEPQLTATANVIKSADQLLSFINNLLGQAQIESGKVVLNITSFTPAELFDTIKSTSTALAHTKGLDLVSEIAPNVPATLSGDPYWLRQILVNLVNNAIKFTQQGTVRVYIYRTDDTQWAMQVSDTGCGIPAEAQAYIFDAFRQVDGTATRKQHTGSGLGLSIVNQLTTLMNGRITLTSQEGQGSTFTVLLPLEPT